MNTALPIRKPRKYTTPRQRTAVFVYVFVGTGDVGVADGVIGVFVGTGVVGVADGVIGVFVGTGVVVVADGVIGVFVGTGVVGVGDGVIGVFVGTGAVGVEDGVIGVFVGTGVVGVGDGVIGVFVGVFVGVVVNVFVAVFVYVFVGTGDVGVEVGVEGIGTIWMAQTLALLALAGPNWMDIRPFASGVMPLNTLSTAVFNPASANISRPVSTWAPLIDTLNTLWPAAVIPVHVSANLSVT